jgi:hypothetical protein
VKKPVKSSQKKFLLFLNTNPLPPVSLGFLNRQSQIPFRQAARCDQFAALTLTRDENGFVERSRELREFAGSAGDSRSKLSKNKTARLEHPT